MKRYTFIIGSPGWLDAGSREEALKRALENGMLTLRESVIPKVHELTCTIAKNPDASGKYSAFARTDEGEVVATADAPTPERALRALGYENPQAHMHHEYKRRYGNNYKLILEQPSVPQAPATVFPAK